MSKICRSLSLYYRLPVKDVFFNSDKTGDTLATSYADRGDWRKSPGVPGEAIAIFVNRGYQICRDQQQRKKRQVCRRLKSDISKTLFWIR